LNQTLNEERPTLTDLARIRLKGILDPIGRYLNRLGISPNAVTLLGLAGHILAAYFAAAGEMTIAGLFIILLGPVDALDGTMARLKGESSKWGAFVDSVVDRYSELFIFGGLLVYFTVQAHAAGVILSYLSASGSILVSYVRARAQALGYEVKVGWFSRLERYLVLVPALILNFPLAGLAILGVGAHMTSLQRIFAMRAQAYQK
jgi:CDP-diacylglycerol--glycerol-3-phosphate 3-phosphatidyltransferase